MQTSLGRIAVAQEPLQKLSTLALSVRDSYDLLKLVRLLEPEFRLFEERRVAIVNALGVDVPDKPGMKHIPPEQVAAYTAQFNELASIPVEIAWKPFDLDRLPAGTTLSARELALLGLGDEDGLVTMSEDAAKPSETQTEKSI